MAGDAADALLDEAAAELAGADGADGGRRAEDALQPPPGPSKAQLRAWKHRQKILNAGSNRMELLTGSRDAVAKDAVEEFRNEAAAASGDAGTATVAEASTPADGEGLAAGDEEPKLARWEQRWNKAAEKAPVVELPAAPPVASKPTPEEPSAATTLRQRQTKGGKRVTDAGTPTGASALQSGEVGTQPPSFNALREKMRRDRWGVTEFWVRQALLICTALALAVYFSQVGGIVAPSDDLSVIAAKNAHDDYFDVEDPTEHEVKLTFGDDDDDDDVVGGSGDLGSGASGGFVHHPETQTVMIPSLAGGILSVPVTMLLFRGALHLLVSLGAGIPFSLVESARYPLQAKAEESGLLSRVAGFVPPLAQALEMSGLVRAIMDDTLLFVFVFVTTTSMLQLI